MIAAIIVFVAMSALYLITFWIYGLKCYRLQCSSDRWKAEWDKECDRCADIECDLMEQLDQIPVSVREHYQRINKL